MTHEPVPTKEQLQTLSVKWLLYWLGYFDADGRTAQFELEQCPDDSDESDCWYYYHDEMMYNWRKFNEICEELDRRGVERPRTLHGDESEWNN